MEMKEFTKAFTKAFRHVQFDFGKKAWFTGWNDDSVFEVNYDVKWETYEVNGGSVSPPVEFDRLSDALDYIKENEPKE